MKFLVGCTLGYLAVPYAMMLLRQILRTDTSRYAPAVTWGYTVLILAASKHSVLLGLIVVPQLLLTALMGFNHSSYSAKMFQLPALASIAAYGASMMMPEIPSSAAVAVLGLHFHEIIVGLVRFMILPAAFVHMVSGAEKIRQNLLNVQPEGIISIPSHSYSLDAAVWINKNTAHPERWVLYLGGNGEIYEHSFREFVVGLAQELSANAVMHNIRGVGHSGGTTLSPSDIEEDCSSVISYILSTYKNTKESDILLFGHSIGGCVAANVVAKKHHDCSLVIDRTFSKLSDVAAVIVGLGKYMNFVRWVIDHVFGEMDTVSALEKIRHNRFVCTFHRNDQVIPFNTSSLGRIVEKQSWAIELTGRSVDPHNVPTSFLSGHTELVWRMNNFFEARDAKT